MKAKTSWKSEVFGLALGAGVLLSCLIGFYALAPLSFDLLVRVAQSRNILLGQCLINSDEFSMSHRYRAPSISAYYSAVHKLRRILRPSQQWSLHELKLPVVGRLPLPHSNNSDTFVRGEFLSPNLFSVEVSVQGRSTSYLTFAPSRFLLWRLTDISSSKPNFSVNARHATRLQIQNAQNPSQVYDLFFEGKIEVLSGVDDVELVEQ